MPEFSDVCRPALSSLASNENHIQLVALPQKIQSHIVSESAGGGISSRGSAAVEAVFQPRPCEHPLTVLRAALHCAEHFRTTRTNIPMHYL